MPSSNITAGILQKLGIISKEFMEIMAQKVSANGLPSKINEHTSATSPKREGSKYSVEVVIDTSDKAAPMAGAFEYGSGEHGEKGEKYPIKAKNPEGDPLHFFWVERDKWFVGEELPYGHPGVKAKPYIAPSIVKIVPKMKDILAEEFKRGYLQGTPKVTVISAKK
jgi:hypothetical protein